MRSMSDFCNGFCKDTVWGSCFCTGAEAEEAEAEAEAEPEAEAEEEEVPKEELCKNESCASLAAIRLANDCWNSLFSYFVG